MWKRFSQIQIATQLALLLRSNNINKSKKRKPKNETPKKNEHPKKCVSTQQKTL